MFMKTIASVFVLALSVLASQSGPVIHVGDDMEFEGEYLIGEIGNWQGAGGFLVKYGTGINISPDLADSYLWWEALDFPANSILSGDVPTDPNAYAVEWGWVTNYYNGTLPVGYPASDAQWVTLYYAVIYNTNFVVGPLDTGITPFDSDIIWLDWNQDGTLRETYSATSPINFNRYLSNGSINPSWTSAKKGFAKGHNKQTLLSPK